MNPSAERLASRITVWYLGRAAARIAATGRPVDARIAALIPRVQRAIKEVTP